MLHALLWAAGTGFAARALLSGAKPGPIVTVVAGLGGCLLGFVVGHEALKMHEFHLFRPESLIPAVTGTVVLLMITRRALRATQRQSLFS